MKLKIFSANLAGGSREAKVAKLAGGYAQLIQACAPQILLLQEAAREFAECDWAGAKMRNLDSDTAGDSRDLLGQLAKQLPQYRFFFTPAIQSNRDSHPDKWARSGVEPGNVRGQGCAMAVHGEQVKLLDFWTGKKRRVVEPIELTLPFGDGKNLSIYTGSRDAEPRIAQGLRMICAKRDLVVWNVHLTTIAKERERNPYVDNEAVAIRARQLDSLVNAYQQCRDVKGDPWWIIGGDFNATPQELEGHRGIRENFANAFLGPTRPAGNQVDTILLEPKRFVDDEVAKRRADATKILVAKQHVTETAKEFLKPIPPPEKETNSSLDSNYDACLQELLKQKVDHFPLLIDLDLYDTK